MIQLSHQDRREIFIKTSQMTWTRTLFLLALSFETSPIFRVYQQHCWSRSGSSSFNQYEGRSTSMSTLNLITFDTFTRISCLPWINTTSRCPLVDCSLKDSKSFPNPGKISSFTDYFVDFICNAKTENLLWTFMIVFSCMDIVLQKASHSEMPHNKIKVNAGGLCTLCMQCIKK